MATGQSTERRYKLYTKDQIQAAQSVKFSQVLDHLGATHRHDAEYRPRAGQEAVRILIRFEGQDFRATFKGAGWAIDRPTKERGKGTVSFVERLTGRAFPQAVEVCLLAQGANPAPGGVALLPACEGKQTELPLWPEPVRAAPNDLLRSALFNARNPNLPRESYLVQKPLVITVLGDGDITYAGEELRQTDEKIWLQLIHLARTQPPGEPIEFVASHFCKEIGLAPATKNFKLLALCIRRLLGANLAIRSRRDGTLGKPVNLATHGIPLIGAFKHTGDGTRNQKWQVTIHPAFVQLFADDYYTRIEWEQRRKLPDGLATWLHGYFSSHRDPIPVRIQELARGAGLLSADLDNVVRSFRRALKALVDVKFLQGFRIDSETWKVTVMRQK